MICFFNTNKAWGGGEKWHFETALFLRAHGNNICIAAYPGSELLQRAQQQNIKVIPVTISNLDFANPLKIYKLKNIFRQNAIDTLILNLSSDVKCAAIAGKLAGVTNIIYRRGMAKPVGGSLINKYIFKKILTLIVSNSKDIQNKLLLNHPYLKNSPKLKIVYNGVVPEKFGKINQKESSEKLIIGNTGRLVEQKKQCFLVKLAVKLKQNPTIDFQIQIAGDGPLVDDLKRKAKELEVEDRIHFKGFVANMAEFYRGIDLFVLTSEHEGSSNALIEAMAWGLPVIAFDISSMPEMVENERNGYLIPYGDLDALVSKILLLHNSQTLRQEMGLRSKMIVNERFNMEKNLETLFSLSSSST